MNLQQRIKQAFADRAKPTRLIDAQEPVTPDQKDSLWFSGREWQDVTWDDWESHRDALYAFTPEAFAYYLPSILCLSSQSPEKWFWPADSLLQVLDRSPVVEYWDSFILTRLVGLKTPEYEVLKEWLLVLSEQQGINSEDTLGRAFDTVNLLQNETSRVRMMIHSIQKPNEG
jgi:hypothetical protein